jgi:hypothetical protein
MVMVIVGLLHSREVHVPLGLWTKIVSMGANLLPQFIARCQS